MSAGAWIKSGALGSALLGLTLLSGTASALLIGVSGPNSTDGTAPSIIAAPAFILDDVVTNTGMEGFNEAIGVVTTVDYSIDGGGVIAAGTRVDSHMIFLNSEGTRRLTHSNVNWIFDELILGVMSDSGGLLEAASTPELGAPGTVYPTAGFPARGLEGGDSYVVSGSMLTLSMVVTEPGDWIRVVTASAAVPEPGVLGILGLGLLALGVARRRSGGSVRG